VRLRTFGCLIAFGAVALLTPPSPAPAGRACATIPAGWRPHVEDARRWAATRRGTVSFAVRTPSGRLRGRHTRRTVPAASVLKAMLLVAYLDRARSRPLNGRDLALLDPMVRRSDNVTATRVRDIVGAAGLYRVARRAGMRHFRVHPVWGLSRTDAADQTRFFLRLERHVAARHRATALRLLRTIVRSQRWGIGRLRLGAWRLYFKGGWGSGTGRVDHQVVLLRGCGADRVAVAVMTTAQGSHAYGKRTLEGVFRRLLRGLVAQ
jgi:Beta-lactamase enzyme family